MTLKPKKPHFTITIPNCSGLLFVQILDRVRCVPALRAKRSGSTVSIRYSADIVCINSFSSLLIESHLILIFTLLDRLSVSSDIDYNPAWLRMHTVLLSLHNVKVSELEVQANRIF